MANEFDDIMPNSQTPRGGNIGSSDKKWGIIHSTSGSFDTLILSNTIISGVISYDQAMFKGLLEPSALSFVVEHNLGVELVDVIIIDEIGDRVNPNTIKILDSNSIFIDFVELQSGQVLVQKGK